MSAKELDFYQSLRRKIKDWLNSKDGSAHKWAEYILLAPDLFYLLYKLTLDKDVLVTDKIKLAAAIAYFISPIDLLSEALLGPAGYVDDIALAAFVLKLIISNTDPEVVRRHWAGEGDVLEVVQSILKAANKMIGSGLWNKLKANF